MKPELKRERERLLSHVNFQILKGNFKVKFDCFWLRRSSNVCSYTSLA